MMFQRPVLAVSRRVITPRVTALRSFTVSVARPSAVKATESGKPIKSFSEIKTKEDLLSPGAAPGTVPTDLDQATGLERLEILGKMEGVDIFNMKPLDSSRKGTFDNPITVQSFGEEQYLGCTGCPADSHIVIWLTVSKDRPFERCPECGSIYKMDYVGPEHDDAHGTHGDHGHHPEPQKDVPTMADFVKPQYW